MVCEYELENGVLKVNCLGCIHGASIEDYEACMARTVDKIIENKDVESVILSKEREYEYNYEQTRMLIELAEAIRNIVRDRKLLNLDLFDRNCINLLGPKLSNLNSLIMGKMRRDPVGAYISLKRMIRHNKIRVDSASERGAECYEELLNKVLFPIKEIFDELTLIKKAKPIMEKYKTGDRAIYRDMFHPTIRPKFMRTKYVSVPPKDSEIVNRYSVGDVEVEIYKKPESVRYFYHVTPPEFKLSEDKYTILDAAIKYLIEHKPREAEFAEPEKTRDVFFNIGKDLISDIAGQMGIRLSTAELKKLTSILVRYTSGLGMIEVLLADPKVQDIYINSPAGEVPIYLYHGDFQECETNLIPTQQDAEYWATRFRIISGRPLDEANPVLDTQASVPGGTARIAVITRSLSPEGLGFAIRRHRDKPWTYPLFLQPDVRYLNPIFAGFMSFIIDYSRTFLIGGTRSSGKTSLLNASMLEIMRKNRIVTVEDTLELNVDKMKQLGFNIERLKSRSVITQVETELPTEEAIRTALRLGDSCLILGEVRSTEAKALYEAMRIGALANTVAGTIHGDSAYGVFDRVVNDLGVPPTSFKATDLVIICNMLRSPDGLHNFRRVVAVTEVRKHWKEDPMREKGFVNLLEYSAKDDELKPTPTLLNGESFVLNDIASKVREWSGNWAAVWDNINLRSRIKKAITEYALKTGNKDLMEAPFVVKSNEKFHIISDEIKRETGSMDPEKVYDHWEEWAKKEIKKGII